MTKVLTTLLATLFFTFYLQAQDVEKAISDYYNNYPKEKFYTHFDKDSYAPGQTIWFKTYILHNGFPSGLSTNFYVLLVNAKQEVVATKMYPVNGASGVGNIDLPLNTAEGDYFLYAATTNTINKNASSFFVKKISISKSKNKAVVKSAPSQINFYPESGSLIDGILTVIAFQAKDSLDNPVDVSGNITNAAGVKVPFKTYYNGIGKLQFRPKAGQTYYAEVESGGRTLKFELPPVKTKGINVRVEDEPGGKQFLISRNEKDGNELNDINLIVEIEGRVVYNNNISFNDYPSVKGHLITDSLPSGILHFTVFDSKMQPIAERLSFINNKEYVSPLNINLNKSASGTDNSYNLQISSPDAVQNSLSLSITEIEDHFKNDPGIITPTLINSLVSKPVPDLSTYFTLGKDSAKYALDNLMLVSQLKDFKLANILSNKNNTVAKTSEEFIKITGVVEEVKDKEPLKGGTLNIYLVDADSAIKNYSVPVSPQGRFELDSMVFYGAGKFYYTFLNPSGKKKTVKINVDERSEKMISFAGLEEDNLTTQNLKFTNPVNTMQGEESAKSLEDVTVYSKGKRAVEEVNDKYTSGLFKNKGKVIIDNINEPYSNQSISLLRYLQLNVNTVKFQNGKFVNTKNFSMNSMQYWEVGVLLDEVLTTVGNLSSINMTDVALIKFYEAGFSGVSSNTSPGGAIAVYLKKNEGSKPQQNISEDYFWYNGYSVVKKFIPEEKSIQNFNFSKTILWNPSLFTSKEESTHNITFEKPKEKTSSSPVVFIFITSADLLKKSSPI